MGTRGNMNLDLLVVAIFVRTLCARMRLIVDRHHVLDGELCVALRGGEALVPEEFLNGAQVGPFVEHVCAEGVAEGMRVHVGRKAFGDCNALDDAPNTPRGETAPALVDEERWCGLV